MGGGGAGVGGREGRREAATGGKRGVITRAKSHHSHGTNTAAP